MGDMLSEELNVPGGGPKLMDMDVTIPLEVLDTEAE